MSRPWTEHEVGKLRRAYGKAKVGDLARSLNRSVKSVYLKAIGLGLTRSYAARRPGFGAFIRAKNAAGWSDAEIAAKWGCDRHSVSDRRRAMGLPYRGKNERWVGKIRRAMRQQCERAGVQSLAEVRVLAFRAYAERHGWPTDLPPRCVQILNALAQRGPMTRREIVAALGMKWHSSRKALKGGRRVEGGSYLACLMRRGLVVSFKRMNHGQGKGRSTDVYSLSLTAQRSG